MNPPGKIKIVTASIECRMCPTVISGRADDGATVYCRYRWGRLVVRLDHENPPTLGGAAGAWILDKQIDPEGIAGCLDYETLREITAEFVEWPETPTQKTHDSQVTTWPEDVEG